LSEDQKEESSTNEETGFIEFPNKNMNRRIALASGFGAVGLFLSSRLDFGVSLKDLAANALSYEEVRQFEFLNFFFLFNEFSFYSIAYPFWRINL
jgi:hypothetical protein